MTASIGKLERMTSIGTLIDGRLPHVLKSAGFISARVADELRAKSTKDVLSDLARYSFYYAYDPDLLKTQVGVLIHLFLLGASVPHETYCALLPASVRAALGDALLVTESTGTVSSDFNISPLDDLYILSDHLVCNLPDHAGLEFCPNAVMPPHASTFVLLEYLSGDRLGGLVDLGCGSGVLGLALGDPSDSLLGVDINERAVRFSALNALLNIGPMTPRVRFASGNVKDMGLKRKYSTLIFNSPTGPGRAAGRTPGRMSAKAAVTLAAETAACILAPAGRSHIFCMIERSGSALDCWAEIASWRLPGGMRAHFEAVNAPYLTLRRADLEAGRVDPRCPFLMGRNDAPDLLQYMTSRGIDEIIPAIVSLR